MEYVIIIIGLIVVVGLGYWLSSKDEPEEEHPVTTEPDPEPEPIDDGEKDGGTEDEVDEGVEEMPQPPTIAVEELGLEEHVESILLDEGLNTVSDLRDHGDFTSIHGIGPARSKKIYQSVIDYVKENEVERIDVKDL